MLNDAQAAIVVSNVSKVYQGGSSHSIEAIRSISLSVSKDEIVCILGRSGCGKSTLLNMIAGLLEPTHGEIFVCGQPVAKNAPDIGYIQQSPQLLPYRTVLANAALGLELRGRLHHDSLHTLHALLSFLGLSDFLHYYPQQLSGGMRQRVALARALAVESPLLLCDEPFSSLDFDSRIELEGFFWAAIKKNHKASLFVTHQIDSAITLADRVVILSPRPASVATVISIDAELSQHAPLQRRDSPLFAQYFSAIWGALRVAAEAAE